MLLILSQKKSSKNDSGKALVRLAQVLNQLALTIAMEYKDLPQTFVSVANLFLFGEINLKSAS
jgi:hypothetical protein